ncbi:hypothetical protein GCM10009798_29080 [Nocardioides panacihumi]|uniref:Uncharacterized protein n=1 Tax=Nocardioides panacihumi TaxID=400774 RepID=A0ABP5CPG4_9ACTN
MSTPPSSAGSQPGSQADATDDGVPAGFWWLLAGALALAALVWFLLARALRRRTAQAQAEEQTEQIEQPEAEPPANDEEST